MSAQLRPIPRSRQTQIGLLALLLLTALLMALLVAPATQLAPRVLAQDKSLVWDRFDTDIEIHRDGSFTVTERQTIHFTRGDFSVGYRDIPIQRLSHIDDWQVSDDRGNVYQQRSGGEADYTFTVRAVGETYVIEWFFPATSGTTYTFTLRYRVHGALRFYDTGDQMWWQAVYADRPFPVEASRVRVILPDGATVQEWAAYINDRDARPDVTAAVMDNSQVVVYETRRALGSGEGLNVRVEFTPDLVDGAPAAWQTEADAEEARRAEAAVLREGWGPVVGLGLSALGALLLLGGPALVYLFWYRRGRDKAVDQIAEYLPEPPTSLAPGMAGTLIDERVDMQDIIATLVDLARRKAISITEEKVDSLFSKKTDFIYRRERDDVPLVPYEELLLTGIFGSKDEVRLSDLKDKFYSKVDGIKRGMYEGVVRAGLFPQSPETVRSQYGCAGIALLVVAVGAGIALTTAFESLTPLGFVPGLGLAVTAIALIVAAAFMPRRTDVGAEEVVRWRAFRTYLQNIDKYGDIQAQKEIWDRYLPYAIAFGVEKEYMAKFAQADAPIPGWYFPSPDIYLPRRGWYYGTPGPTAGGGDISLPSGGPGGTLSDMSRGMGTSLSAMSAGLGAMLSSASAAMTSRPASSSSGRSGWGGGGFSGGGGGFSGGGGGGFR